MDSRCGVLNAVPFYLEIGRFCGLCELGGDAYTSKSLTLQIGPIADGFNQLKVNIKDCHTINNLSVMTENIQDAESTTRDVAVAEEM